MAAKELNIESIRIDGGTQPRAKIDEAAVADYSERIKIGDEFPPADVFDDGAEQWLADGFHRYHGHMRAGKKVIRCIIHKGTQRDAILFSVGANGSHGLRRTNADKQKAVDTLITDTEWGQWSSREIAKRCGVSHEMVESRRASLSKSDSDKRVFKSKSGKTSEMDVSNIGKKKDDSDPVPVFFDAPAKADEPTPAPEVKPTKAKLSPPVEDMEGNPIHRMEVLDVFNRRAEIEQMMRGISAIKSAVLNGMDAKDELFRFVNGADFKARAENLYACLKFSLPHALCPAHADDPLARKDCRYCGGSGWLPVEKYKVAVGAHGKAVVRK